MSESFKNDSKNKLNNLLNKKFKIGFDPEIFVEDDQGQMIPAFQFLGGKDNPGRTPGGTKEVNSEFACFRDTGGNTMYWDGFQAEYTTTPHFSLDLATDSLASGLRGIRDAARAKFPNARLSLRSVFDLSQETLETACEEHVAFGCMPSINAYGLAVNMPPARYVSFRSAGGHIHLGLGAMDRETAIPLVKSLDNILGVACVSLFANIDNPRRRIMYGLPGEFRLPTHGVEYRPLSNAWLSHPFITHLVIDLARKAAMLSRHGLSDVWEANEEETVDTIITCNVPQAQQILTRNKEVFGRLLQASYSWGSDSDIEKMFSIFMEGLETVIADPSDFDVNWGMNADDPWQALSKGRNVVSMWKQVLSGEKLSRSVR